MPPISRPPPRPPGAHDRGRRRHRALEAIIERKLFECVRGLREHSSANLYDLIAGLVVSAARAATRDGGNRVRAAQILGINPEHAAEEADAAFDRFREA